VPGALILATDAARDDRRVGAGYLATSGHYGVLGHPYDHQASGERRTVVAELRAVYFGLHHLFRTGAAFGTPVEVRLDNRSALAILEDWARGGTGLPAGCRTWRYGGRTATLDKLRRLVAANTPALTFSHVRAHSGNILNEAADSLAKLGLRCSKGAVTREQLGSSAQHYAEQNLTAYRHG
jgi:ribonuclease HI